MRKLYPLITRSNGGFGSLVGVGEAPGKALVCCDAKNRALAGKGSWDEFRLSDDAAEVRCRRCGLAGGGK